MIVVQLSVAELQRIMRWYDVTANEGQADAEDNDLATRLYNER